MDKNTIIGLVLITLIIIGFSLLNRPSEQELAARRAYNDSVMLAEQMRQAEELAAAENQHLQDELKAQATSAAADSAQLAERRQNVYGPFAPASVGENGSVALENEKIRLTIDKQGGRISSAELKNYLGQDSLPVKLFTAEESAFSFIIATQSQRVMQSADLWFEPQEIVTDTAGTQMLTMRLLTDTDAHIDITYSLPKDDYMAQMTIQSHGAESILPQNMSSLQITWNQDIRQQERGRQFEERYSRLAYKYATDKDIEELSESKEDEESASGNVKWIGYKDQFFSTVLIADDNFSAASLHSTPLKGQYLKRYQTTLAVPFDPTGAKPTSMKIYLGPNHFSTLKAYNDSELPNAERLHLEKLVPLGMKWYSWVNRIAIIPLFNLFSRFISNYGLIILLMTLVIKLVLFPLTYKSYLSSAKMRVIKPQIDEINKKYPPEKMQERQQATMALYSKLGISPMSGCLPLLLQMPILIAVFSFFPTCIDLRGQSFLWADDLSAYDSIFSWDAYIPLITPYFGNHISLFCLLMTVTNIIYTHINMQSQGGTDQFAAMKWMMYLMPVFFMVFFNNYASGLSYYYFVSLLITIIQTTGFRLLIDDKKILEDLNRKANSKDKPKKSGFMERLERMQREQQKRMREQAKQQSRR